MINLTMFNTKEDLCKLTGLDESALLYIFALDDWDVGFCSDTRLTYTEFNENCRNFEKTFEDTCWLVHAMKNRCICLEHVKYNKKHYYLVHSNVVEEKNNV